MLAILTGRSVTRSQLKVLAFVVGSALLSSLLVFTPSSMALGTTPPSVDIAGFPQQAVANQDESFTVSLNDFTDKDGNVDRTFQVAMSVSGENGTLILSTTSEISESPGQPRSGAASIRFTGSLAALNTAMANMTYRATSPGVVTLSVSASHIPEVVPGGNHSTLYDAALPVKWEQSDGGNGHYYQFLKTKSEGSVSWDSAKAAASERTLLSQPGYLATLTTEAENNFVANEIAAPSIWIGASDDRDQIFDPGTANKKYADQTAAEGKWHWVTGPESGTQFMSLNSTGETLRVGAATCLRGSKTYYQGEPFGSAFNGWACGEPNNATHTISNVTLTENFAVTNWGETVGEWNDLPLTYSGVKGFLVEYSGFSAPESAQASASTTAIAAPAAPTINSITAGSRSLTVNVTPGSNGGSAVTNFQYSTDGGSSFVAFDPEVTSGPLTITSQSTTGRPALENNTAYSVRIKAVNIAGASIQSDPTSATPVATKPAAPVITSVTAGNQSLAVAFSISDNGGEEIDELEYQLNGGSFTAFAGTTSPATITGLTNGTSYTVVIKASNSVGTSDNSASATGTPVQPPAPAPTVVTPLATTPTNGNPTGLLRGRITPPTTPTTPLSGPLPSVNGNGQIPSTPNGSIGGRPATVTTNVVGGNQMTLQTGSSTFGVAVPAGQGQVNSGQNGDRELSVQSGASTRLSGSGLLPGSTVQVFLPLGANGSREVSQLPVGPTGSFDGDAVFTTRPTDPPLPVGRNVMQIASLNNAGERVIVEMAINIAQPSPQPGILRSTGAIPSMAPGESFATRAGEPIDVSLSVDEALGTTVFQGDGWVFSVDVSGGTNQVSETPEGGALISVVRGGSASVSGNGFMPLTRADIWLFSDPTLLGTVDIDENGGFSGSVTVDGQAIPVGDHTLQIQGVGEDGFIIAANLGVVVSDEDTTAAATGTSQASATLLWWVIAVFGLVVIAGVVGWRVSTRRRLAR